MAQGDDSGTSTPTAAPAAPAGDDLDFSDLKKKKKSSKKKAAFDLEAFEKELNESKSKGDDDEDEVETNPNLDNIDEAELGDDRREEEREGVPGYEDAAEGARAG